MFKACARSAALVVTVLFVSTTVLPGGRAAASDSIPRKSVVKLYVTAQREDTALPWRSERPMTATGSGFIIEKKRIITNAHVVSDAKFLQVEKEGDSRKYNAKVVFAGHDCDLAIVSIDDPDFFDGTEAVTFAKNIPSLNDEVTVVGYPMGGDRLSITKGVVSRIDHSLYSHSGADQHLVLQVDAAINPGNSGGPVLFNGKVVGLAFQGLSSGDNIGYAIPVPVLNHFLKDVSDGAYHGYPELGAYTMDTSNPALRKRLGLNADNGGVAIFHVDPFGSAKGILKEGDVLIIADGYPIDSDGNIELESNNVPFSELLERKQWGQEVVFDILRDGARQKITVPLKNPVDPFTYRRTYDTRPKYLTVGGLVFSPLSREYLSITERGASSFATHQLHYFAEYAKLDGYYTNRDEFVIMIRRLPNEINTYADTFLNGIVTEVNGVHIGNIRDLKSALEKPQDGFHIFRFEGFNDFLVLDAAQAGAVNRKIMKEYGVPDAEYLGDTK